MCNRILKRIINEHNTFNNLLNKTNNSNSSCNNAENKEKITNILTNLMSNEKNIDELIENFEYKIHTISSGEILFKTDINIKLQNSKNHKIVVYYDNNYPFRCPRKVEIDGYDIFLLYKQIMNKNGDILQHRCLCCKSILCSANWVISYNIKSIILECINTIYYTELYIKRKLLDKIINKYTNEDISFLHNYLLI